MSLDAAQLSALNAVLRLGSFEAAAHALNVSPPAISQRIKALEERVGTTLVNRVQPCTATPLGARLAKHAEDLALLERQALGLDAESATPARLTLAVPADCLATWLIPAFADVPEMLFDIRIDDQDTADDWLKRGAVNGAVTGHDRAAPGCDIHPLGTMRYVATASPAFMAKHLPNGPTVAELERAPMLTFTPKDQLQSMWMKQSTGQLLHPPSHQMPSTHAFVDAALMGMAWGMNPLSLVADHLKTGRLVAISPQATLDIALYWQVARVMAPALAPLTRAILRSAKSHLQ